MNTISEPESNAIKKRKFFFRKRKVQVLLIIIAVLIISRSILPYVLLHYANKRLAAMDGYFGHVDDLDLSIYRGDYKLKSLYIDKVDSVSNIHSQFFDVQMIDLSLQWRALLHGRMVGKMDFEYPSLIFTKDVSDISKVQKDTNDLGCC